MLKIVFEHIRDKRLEELDKKTCKRYEVIHILLFDCTFNEKKDIYFDTSCAQSTRVMIANVFSTRTLFCVTSNNISSCTQTFSNYWFRFSIGSHFDYAICEAISIAFIVTFVDYLLMFKMKIQIPLIWLGKVINNSYDKINDV